MDPKKVEAITFWYAGSAKDLRICQHLFTIHEGFFFLVLWFLQEQSPEVGFLLIDARSTNGF